MIELLGDKDPWVATTAGERLLFLLLRNHQEWRVLADSLTGAKLQIGRRYDNLSSFFVGASVLHLQQRLLRLAHDVRDQVPDRWQQAAELRARACDIIQLTPLDYDGDFGALIEEVLTSAEQMPKEPGPGLKRLVLQNGPDSCYSCGRLFGAIYEDAPAPDGLKATADHIWPRALGGDTNEANLLPACPSCNSAKGHIAAWQMAWIQPVVFADVDEINGLRSLQREVKMALHVRAAMAYAQKNGSTLRDALLAIGPREAPVRIDPDQGYDFFNLRVHDDIRTNVEWTPN
ncbi:MAG TPA: HNH endonuclease signature motif containing protein [Sphingomonas sp.]|nr:HNH endonuclease signature motif containing protein [Sphingomonas sp.]